MPFLHLTGENVVPEQEDETKKGGPGQKDGVPDSADLSSAPDAVSAPIPHRTAPRQLRLLPATAPAPRTSAPSPLPPRSSAVAKLLLSSPELLSPKFMSRI